MNRTKDITFINVKKAYGENTVIDNLNLEIRDGERLVLLGPSGCGKSTTLRMIAGFEEITSGELYMRGEKVNDLPSGKRNVSMVFQNYALYPHMTVEQNITYGLRRHHIEKSVIEDRLKKAADNLELSNYLTRKPAQLSGGQRQRVALARALVKRSDYILLDEPLSNLDAKLRVTARQQLVFLHEMFKQTFIYVTHDQEEAMTLAGRICLMRNGKIQMIDTPQRIYNYPSNVFVANFIGNPGINIFEAEFIDDHLYIEGYPMKIDRQWMDLIRKHGTNQLSCGMRAEHIRLHLNPFEGALMGKILYIEDLGKNFRVSIEVNGKNFWVLSSRTFWKRDQNVYFSPDQNRMYLFDRNTEESIGFPAVEIQQSEGVQSDALLH